jgi:hypothetical protein
MGRKYFGIIPSIITVVFLILAVPACTTNTVANLPEPSYSGNITENLLIALNNNDFAQFSQDFDDGMKKAVSQETFNTQFIGNIKGKIGDYEPNSKLFFSAASQDQYTTVVYFVRYNNEPGATLVQISFQYVNGNPLVSGIVFNSPKLRS